MERENKQTFINQEKTVHLKIVDTDLVLDIKALSDDYQVEPVEFFNRFMTLGVLAKNSRLGERSANRRDILGHETPIFDLLADKVRNLGESKKIALWQKKVDLGIFWLRIKRSTPLSIDADIFSAIYDDYRELGNLLNTTAEKAITGTLTLGVTLAKEERDTNSSIIVSGPNYPTSGLRLTYFPKDDEPNT